MIIKIIDKEREKIKKIQDKLKKADIDLPNRYFIFIDGENIKLYERVLKIFDEFLCRLYIDNDGIHMYLDRDEYIADKKFQITLKNSKTKFIIHLSSSGGKYY